MGLRKKFNLILLTCLLLGFLAVFLFHRNAILLKTEMDLVHQAETAFHITESIRSYNQNEVTPLIERFNPDFLPQKTASYAASQTMADASKRLPSLHYKVAIEQSEMTRYKPNVWQQNIIKQLKNNPDSPSLTTHVADSEGRFLVFAKPIEENNKVIGAKIIRINETDVLAAAYTEVFTFGVILLALLLLIAVVLNVLLNQVVLKPIKNLSDLAQKISQGQSDADEIELSGIQEINQIAMSFNRMQRSLKAAMGMLS